MTKTELVKIAAHKAGLTQAQMNDAYNAIIEVIEEALKDDDKVALVGFGTFELKDVPAKEGINPATGEKIHIEESKKPVLKFSKSFKDSFNG